MKAKSSSDVELYRMWVADDGKLFGYEVIGEPVKMDVNDAGRRTAEVVLWSGNVPEYWKMKDTVLRGNKVCGRLPRLRVTNMKRLPEHEELGWKL